MTATVMANQPADFLSANVFTVPDIAAGRIAPAYVFRQRGTGIWYVLTQPEDEDLAEDMVPMRDLVGHDASLNSLQAMPPGMGARRGDNGAWTPFALARAEAPKPSTTVIRREDTKDEVYRLRRRRNQVGNLIAAILIVLGTLFLMVGGFIIIAVRKLDPVFGIDANLAYGIPILVAGLWPFICGFVVEAKKAALAASLGALMVSVLGGLPLALPEHVPDAFAGLAWLIWGEKVPASLAEILAWEWQHLRLGTGVFLFIALLLWWRTIMLAIANRRLGKAETELERLQPPKDDAPDDASDDAMDDELDEPDGDEDEAEAAPAPRAKTAAGKKKR